jgi:hypothetical protein
MTTLEQYDLIAEEITRIRFATTYISKAAIDAKDAMRQIDTSLRRITSDPQRGRIIGEENITKISATLRRIEKLHELLNQCELGSFSLETERTATAIWTRLP